MTVAYYRRSAPATSDLVDRLEQQVGQRLPDEYREYLLQQDGGRLDNNDNAVGTIFGVGELPNYANIWAKLRVYDGRVPTWLLPVASDEYGNLFALSLRNSDFGSVWLWDHEGEADEGGPPTEDNIELQAPNWPAFLDGLQPI